MSNRILRSGNCIESAVYCKLSKERKVLPLCYKIGKTAYVIYVSLAFYQSLQQVYNRFDRPDRKASGKSSMPSVPSGKPSSVVSFTWVLFPWWPQALRPKGPDFNKILVKKAYELTKLCDVDVALIVHKNGRYHTYRSIESWLPCMKQIVSSTTLIYLVPSSN